MDRQEIEKQINASCEALKDFAARYRADAEVRARIDRGDVSDIGLDLPEGIEVRVVEQTADTYYLPLPQSPAAALSDEALAGAAGGTSYPHSPSGGAYLNTVQVSFACDSGMVFGQG